MTILYNCYSTPTGHRIVKFDNLLNVEAVYNLTFKRLSERTHQYICDCPGWPRLKSCRHTKMRSIFHQANAINTDRFLCYETQTWHKPVALGNEPPMKEKLDLFNEALTAEEIEELPDGLEKDFQHEMQTTTAVAPQPCKPRETAKQIVAEQMKPIRRI